MAKRKSRMGTMLLAAGAAAIGLWWLVSRKPASATPKPPNTTGNPPSWMPSLANISQTDRIALSSYPENPQVGKMILITHPTQGQTWVDPSILGSFLKPVGEWSALPYPYPQ